MGRDESYPLDRYDYWSTCCAYKSFHDTPHNHQITTCPLLSPVMMTGCAKLKLMWVKRAWLFETTALWTIAMVSMLEKMMIRMRMFGEDEDNSKHLHT